MEEENKKSCEDYGKLWMERIDRTCRVLFIIGIILIVIGAVIFWYLFPLIIVGVIMLFAKYLSIPTRAHAQMVMDTRVIRDKLNKIEADEYDDDDEF